MRRSIKCSHFTLLQSEMINLACSGKSNLIPADQGRTPFRFNERSFSLRLLKIPNCASSKGLHTPPGSQGVVGAVLRITYSYPHCPVLKLLTQTPPSPELPRYHHSHTDPLARLRHPVLFA